MSEPTPPAAAVAVAMSPPAPPPRPIWERLGINASVVLAVLTITVTGAWNTHVSLRDATVSLRANSEAIATLRAEFLAERAARSKADDDAKVTRDNDREQARRDTDVSRAERNRELASIGERLTRLESSNAEFRGRVEAQITALNQQLDRQAAWYARLQEQINRLAARAPTSPSGPFDRMPDEDDAEPLPEAAVWPPSSLALAQGAPAP